MSPSDALPLSFSVPGIPRPKERPRLGKGGHVYTPARTAHFEESVRVYAMQAVARFGWRFDAGARYALTLRVFQSDGRRIDLDNVAKAISDALNGLAFADDSQVDRLVASRTRSALPADQRVEVEVARIFGE
jgi:Holliday junction resolvase RusA-like endonuclease